VATSPTPAPARREHWLVGLAGLAAFFATLAIPAIAALWWLLAAATLVSVGSVTGLRLRRVSPGGAAARGR
jgi:MYXO-CTERM domain-containing protein